MSIRKLEPGELIDPSIYCGKNGIKVKSIERNSFFYPEQKDYLFKVGYANGLFCLVDINGHAYQNADYDLQVIIESPEPEERDWSSVVEELLKCANEIYATHSFFNENIFRCQARLILQQCDKLKVEPVTVKMWVNVYDNGTFNPNHTSQRSADYSAKIESATRIACKELEFSYVPGEVL